MDLLVGILILAVLALPLVIALSRANELFCVRVRGGKFRLVRGRLPARLLEDIRDVLKRARVQDGQLRVVSEQGKPRVVARGIREADLQKLRNVVGSYQVAQIRAGTRRRRG
jgi:hypothetical protein